MGTSSTIDTITFNTMTDLNNDNFTFEYDDIFNMDPHLLNDSDNPFHLKYEKMIEIEPDNDRFGMWSENGFQIDTEAGNDWNNRLFLWNEKESDNNLNDSFDLSFNTEMLI